MTSAASKSSPCDERLFALYKQTGDETYFEMVYNRRKEGIRRFLLKFLHPQRHDQIDDLIQTVFAELHRLSPRFDAGNFSVNGWLLQSAESFARDLNVLRTPAHVILLEVADKFANSGFALSVGFHANASLGSHRNRL